MAKHRNLWDCQAGMTLAGIQPGLLIMATIIYSNTNNYCIAET